MRRLLLVITLAPLGCRREPHQSTPASTAMQAMPGMPGMPAGGSANVRLTADEIRRFGVTFDTVKVRPLVTSVRTTGTVMADETRLAAVTLKIGGYVERLYVDQTGQRVRRGQSLVAVYSPDVVAAQDELLVAARLDSTAGGASSLVDAGKRRLLAWGVPEDQVDRVLATGAVEHAVTLVAPVTGVVLDKNVVQGQAIHAGDVLLSVADLSSVWVNADVRENDASDVHVGSRATVRLSAYPGRSFNGTTSFIYPTVQGDARTVTARIVMPNRDGMLKPGMYATVDFATASLDVLSVPSSALFRTGDKSLAFVDMGSGSLMPHEVVAGRVAGDLTEIVSGLQSGQRVVTSAQYLLDSESNLAEVMKSMIGQLGRTDSMRDMPGMEMRRDSGRR